MSYQNLALVLSAFVNRLSANDMHQLNRAVLNCWEQQNSGSTSQQLTAQNQCDGVVQAVIARMLQSDRDSIVNQIESLT